MRRSAFASVRPVLGLALLAIVTFGQSLAAQAEPAAAEVPAQTPLTTMLFVFMLATFIGLGVITRVSRLLHTPLMSLTNAISAIAVVGAIALTGSGDYPLPIRILGAIALFASMTNIVSGFLITDRMLKMFKTKDQKGPQGKKDEKKETKP
jgi:NAD(P) transhydrogenase subunit alpha